MDLNPVFATKDQAVAADVRIVVDFSPKPARYRPKHEDIVRDMNRIMKPKAALRSPHQKASACARRTGSRFPKKA